MLQWAFDPPDVSGRQFLFQPVANSVPLADHQRLFQLMGGIDGFFHPFYAQMFRANGGWDFALFDLGFGAIVEVRGRGRDSLSIDIHHLLAP